MLFSKNKFVILGVATLSLFIFNSCNAFIKVFYGVRNPKIETKESLVKYLEKNELSTENVYCVDIADYKYGLNGQN